MDRRELEMEYILDSTFARDAAKYTDYLSLVSDTRSIRRYDGRYCRRIDLFDFGIFFEKI